MVARETSDAIVHRLDLVVPSTNGDKHAVVVVMAVVVMMMMRRRRRRRRRMGIEGHYIKSICRVSI